MLKSKDEDVSKMTQEELVLFEGKRLGYLIGHYSSNLSSDEVDLLLKICQDRKYITMDLEKNHFSITTEGIKYIKSLKNSKPTKVVLDTNIFYNYKDFRKSISNISNDNEYFGSIYNMEDLISSKDNIDELDKRLKHTLPYKLRFISNHEVFAFEPHYYLIEDIFPECLSGKYLYQYRYNLKNPSNIFNLFSQIIKEKENVSDTIKDKIVQNSQESRTYKRLNNEEVLAFAKQYYNNIGYKSKEEVKWEDFIPFVEDLVIKQLNIYRKEFMLKTEEINQDNFDPKKCELFIKTYSIYLAKMVQKENYLPALNDNLDSLLLLYVKPDMKFMTKEIKCVGYIKEVGLKDYLLNF